MSAPKTWSVRKTSTIAAAVLAVALALLLATEEWGLAPRESDGLRWDYLLEDPHDRFADMQYGYWLPARVRPYLDEFSPYPQVTTWAMGAPWLFLEHGIERGEPIGSIRAARDALARQGVPERPAELLARARPQAGLQQGVGRVPARGVALERLATLALSDPEGARAALERSWSQIDRREEALAANAKGYGDLHQVFMGILFLAAIVLLALALREQGASPAWALVLLLPGTLYFGFSRHETLVMALLLAALLLQLRGRVSLAAGVLALAAMTKLWPGLLLPLFLSHAVHSERTRLEARGEAVRWRTLLARHALLPGAVAGAVVLATLGVTYLQGGGGVDAVTYLFRWHAGVREPNHSSLLALLTNPERWGWFPPESRDGLELAFKGLQVLPAIALALFPVRGRRALLHGTVAVAVGAALWSEFFSPQWVWWCVPPALLLARRYPPYAVLAPLLAAGIYVQLPLVFYRDLQLVARGEPPTPLFWSVIGARAALFLVLWMAALAGFFLALRSAARPAAETAAGRAASPLASRGAGGRAAG